MIGYTPFPQSGQNLSQAEKDSLIGAVDCDALKGASDVIRLAHGDATPRNNAEGVPTTPTDPEGFRKWPTDWRTWWNSNVTALVEIMSIVPVASITVAGAPDDELMVDFGDQDVATTSPARSITIKNKGIGSLKIKTVVRSGDNPTDFDDTPGQVPDFVILPGLTETIVVDFTPGAAGSRLASLDITTNDPKMPLVCVALCGDGVIP